MNTNNNKLEEIFKKVKDRNLYLTKINEILLKYRNVCLQFVKEEKCDDVLKDKINNLESEYKDNFQSFVDTNEDDDLINIDKNDHSDLHSVFCSSCSGSVPGSISTSVTSVSTMTSMTTSSTIEQNENQDKSLMFQPRRSLRQQEKSVNIVQTPNTTVHYQLKTPIKLLIQNLPKNIPKKIIPQRTYSRIAPKPAEKKNNEIKIVKIVKIDNKKSSADGVKMSNNQKAIGKPKIVDNKTVGWNCDAIDCKYFANSRRKLTRHYNLSHIAINCNLCDKLLKNRRIFRYHLKTVHTNEKPFVCDYPNCNKSFSIVGSLKKHKKIHIPISEISMNELFSCDWPDCTYIAKSKSRLDVHKRTHTKEKPFKCDFDGCDKNFASKSNLENHKLIHTGERNFRCFWPGCENTYKSKYDLQRHLIVHTGEKPIKCDWPGCDFRCGHQKNLYRHKMRVHSLVRNYACTWPGCEKKFFSKDILRLHVCTHTGEKTVKCDFPGCDKKFILKGNMRHHYRNIHSKFNKNNSSSSIESLTPSTSLSHPSNLINNNLPTELIIPDANPNAFNNSY